MQKIQIDSFGPITWAEIEVSKIVVLIGEQASGKSTIAKLIYFFKSLKEDFFTIMYEKKDYANYFAYFQNSITNKFNLFFPFLHSKDSFVVRFYYSNDFFISISKKTKNDKIIVNFKLPKTINEKISEVNKLVFQKKELDEFLVYITQKDAILNFISELFQDNLPSMFVPAGRNITVTYSREFKLLFFGELSKQFDKLLENRYEEKYVREYSADTYLMKEYLQKIERIIDDYNHWDLKDELKGQNKKDYRRIEFAIQIINKILKGEYIQDDSGEKIVYGKDKNEYVYLHNASSGQQEVIRILQDLFILIRYKKDVFRVIEEPEAHLYPVAQKNLIELMATVVNSSESQIIITTHSPYILSVLNNLIYANKVSKLNNKEVNKVVSEFIQIKSNDFKAYSSKKKNGFNEFVSIVDSKTGMIAQNYLDDVSEELGDDFDRLYNIHSQSL